MLAEKTTNDGLRLFPDDFHFYYFKALLYMKTDEYAKAMDFINEGMKFGKKKKLFQDLVKEIESRKK